MTTNHLLTKGTWKINTMEESLHQNYSFAHLKMDRNLGSSTLSPSTMSIDNLLPALLECFGIILCGYIAGRLNIITPTQAKGLGSFVSKFALPALLFKNMVVLNFGNVIWPYLWSILVAKVCVFLVVCLLTLLVASPDSRFSKAGLYSIFATQSNDFALGYPIVEALYKATNPDYLQYIYLVAPVSLILLNPIGFVLCEIQKWKNDRNQKQSKLRVVGHVVSQVLRNPIVFMVIIGIIANFALSQRIPTFMAEFVDGLANSFGGAALFYLGLTMVGRLGKLTRSTVITLILLTTAKLLLMPLICKDMVDVLDSSNSSSQNHSSLSNYAFLYGILPTAPSVALYAVHYNAELEVVASGMVISTFLSAPILYVSAWLLTIRWMDPGLLMNALQNVSFNISILSLVTLVWTMAVMFLSKQYKRLPHLFTVNLLTAQCLTCLGMILWYFVVGTESVIGKVLTFTWLSTSLYSTYLWPGLIALSLVLSKRWEDLKDSPGLFVVVGWGLPAGATAMLLICGERTPGNIDPSFFFGKPQIISSTIILALSILLAGGCFVDLSRGTWDRKDHKLARDSSCSPAEILSESEPEDGNPLQPANTCLNVPQECIMCDCAPPQTTPNMIISTDTKNNPNTLSGQCGNSCESSDCLLVRVEEEQEQASNRQTGRHMLLCLLLTITSLASLSSSLWLLFDSVPGRLYLELQFFCAVTNFGQGLISFGLFGLDKHFILLPFQRRVRNLFSKKTQHEPVQSVLPEEVRVTCMQFTKYHKEQCHQDIVQSRRCGKRTMVQCFLGSDLVDWLLRVGLAPDRSEAVLYGVRLEQGDVIQHISREHGFQDGDLNYRFTSVHPRVNVSYTYHSPQEWN